MKHFLLAYLYFFEKADIFIVLLKDDFATENKLKISAYDSIMKNANNLF